MADPRVFISYSHDSEPHREAVLQLAQQFRGWGVDVQMDRFASAPDEGWPRWMMAQVDAADFVFLVCTPTYRRRFEGLEVAGKGKGATFEGLLAIQHLYDASTRNKKFIPLVFEGVAETDIPLVLRPYTRYMLPGQLEALYRHITDQPEIVAVPLGPRKVLLPRAPAAPPPISPTTASATSASTVRHAALAPATIRSEGGRDVQIEPAELLHRLLLSLFSSADQFRQWVAHGPDGDDLVAEFPSGSVSTSAAIFGGLDVLHRRGYLDTEFFARLAADFSRRRDSIAHAAATWGASPVTTHGGIHFGKVTGNIHIQAGGDIVAGDQNVTTTCVAPSSSHLGDALDALRTALAALGRADHKKIDRALADAAKELGQEPPDRNEVHEALARAVKRVAPEVAAHPEIAGPLAILRAWTGA